MPDIATEQLIQMIDEGIDRNKTVQGIKAEQERMAAEQERMAAEQERMSGELSCQGILMEELRDHVKLIAEAVTPLLTKIEQFQIFEDELAEQKAQLRLTQAVLKNHIEESK